MVKVLRDGLLFGESVRWHAGRVWACDWGTGEIVAVSLDGDVEVVARVAPFPLSIDWLRDGRMLIVAGGDSRLLTLEPDGSLSVHAQLPTLPAARWNELAVDPRGTVFVNGGEGIAAVDSAGATRWVADGLSFPNGMALTADGNCLLVAESHAGRITAFDVGTGGEHSARRAWAAVAGSAPDGICLDREGMLWYADVPNRRCVRVAEGGETQQVIDSDRGCFSRAVGGPDEATLFIAATERRGFEHAFEEPRTGTLEAVDLRGSPPPQ